MVGFDGFLDIGYEEDPQIMRRQIVRWKLIVSRFKYKLIKMIEDVNARLHDYTISPKIIQIFWHQDYELVEDDLI